MTRSRACESDYVPAASPVEVLRRYAAGERRFTDEKFRDGILAECESDHVDLRFIVGGVRDDLGVSDEAERRSLSLKTVADLLERGMVAGQFRGDEGFVKMGGSKEQILQFIRDEWEKLGRDPRISEIAWFTSPD